MFPDVRSLEGNHGVPDEATGHVGSALIVYRGVMPLVLTRALAS